MRPVAVIAAGLVVFVNFLHRGRWDCIFQGSSWLLSICKMGQQKPPHRKTDYRFQGGVADAAGASAGAAVAAPLVLAPE